MSLRGLRVVAMASSSRHHPLFERRMDRLKLERLLRQLLAARGCSCRSFERTSGTWLENNLDLAYCSQRKRHRNRCPWREVRGNHLDTDGRLSPEQGPVPLQESAILSHRSFRVRSPIFVFHFQLSIVDKEIQPLRDRPLRVLGLWRRPSSKCPPDSRSNQNPRMIARE